MIEGYRYFSCGSRRLITVAFRASIELDTVEFGYAFCSPRDTFSKKRGRLIARGRLEKGGACSRFVAAELQGRRIKEAARACLRFVVRPRWLDKWRLDVEKGRLLRDAPA